MAAVGTSLEERAIAHLHLHFTSMEGVTAGAMPVIVAGEGPYIIDQRGNRYLDFLAGLFTVQIGYSYGEELGQAALEQAIKLPYYQNWNGTANEPAVLLAERLAGLAPEGISRVFFTSGGSESNESAIKLARDYHAARGDVQRRKVIARRTSYHGTTFGALSLTGVTKLRTQYEPLMPGVRHVSAPNGLRGLYAADPDPAARYAEELARTIEFEGPETVSMVIMEPVQNSGGCLTPPPGYYQAVREVCDRYGVLLVADEVICGFGRLGEWFGSELYDIRPDMITVAKGLTSGYQPMGAVLFGDRIAEALASGKQMFRHGLTFGGHPICSAVALKNLEIMEREELVENVGANAGYFESRLRALADRHDIVGDVRGAGYFWAIEIVRDSGSLGTFSAPERDRLLRGFLAPEMLKRGLIGRPDDRGDSVVHFSPPLICTREHIDTAMDIVDAVLGEAAPLVASF